MKLSDLAVDRPVTTFMALAAMMVLGWVAIYRLPLGFMPEIDEPWVSVEVNYPNAHPLEIVNDLIEPLEDELALVPGLVRLTADANPGSANLSLQFKNGENVAMRRLEVRDAVDRARPKLPKGIGRIQVAAERGGNDNEAIMQGRISAERDLSRDWDLIQARVKGRLERIAGVARVDMYGIDPPRLDIELDLDALRRFRIQPERIMRTIEAANSDLAMGVLRGPSLRFDVRGGGRPESAEQIAALPIAGTALKIGDVARVRFASPELTYARRLNRKPAIGFDVFKAPAANTVEIADRLAKEIEGINADPQLRGVTCLAWKNQAEEIKLSLHGLFTAGWHGGILSILVMLMFLRRFSTTAVLAFAIPFSLISTCAAMFMLGMELNVLTMLGLMLGVGLLVDDAIVVVENVHRLQEQGVGAIEAARRGANEVALAVTASTATTVIVWAWLLFADWSEMKVMLGQIAVTVSLAISCSLLISLTFIPLTVARFIKPRHEKPGVMERWLLPAYRRFLALTLKHRMATLLILIGIAASTAIPFKKIEMSGEPKLMPTRVPINYFTKEPMTLERMTQVVSRVEEAIWPVREQLGIKDLYSYFTENGWGVTMMVLPRELANEKHVDLIRKTVRPLLPTIPGVELKMEERGFFRGMMRGSGGGDHRMAIAFHGSEAEAVLAAIDRAAERLSVALPKGMQPDRAQAGEQREARIYVDPDRLRRAGATPDGVSMAVASIFRGQYLKRLHTPRGEREVFIAVPERNEVGLVELANVPVPVLSGGTVPLDAVAEISIGATPQSITREDRRVTQWLGLTFPKEMTTEQARHEVERAMTGFRLPLGTTWDYGYEGQQRADSLAQMANGTLLSLLVVMLLMAGMFESLAQPLAIFITLPLAFCGAAWILWIGGYELDVTGFMGVIILIGIVVKNGIVMVDHINMLRQRGISRREAVITGSADRVRPVLMTAICTIVGLVPLAASRSTVAGAYIDSMAVVVIGGMTSSTIFTLLGLPVWYTVLEDLVLVIQRAVRGRALVPID